RSTPILINFFTDGLLLCGAPATTPWHYDAVEERPSTSSATGAMSHSRWPRSPSREICLPTSWGWSRNCGHHRQPYRREALDCFASDQKPKERCVWMTTKSAFSALGAPMSLAWVHESPCRAFDIAKIRRKRQA